jgi:diguanylate cyclase (GGDEF)-like protein
VRGAGKITTVAGGLPVLVAWLVGITGLPAAQRPVSNVLAEVMAVLLVILAWRFRRGRLAVAAVAVALANHLIRGSVGGEPVGPGLVALAVVLPTNIAVISLLRERPITRPVIMLFVGVVAIQAWLISNLGGGLGSPASAYVANSFDALVTAPHISRLIFLIAAVFVALAFAARRGTFEGSLLWVLAAGAVALLGWRGPHAATLAFSAAQLVLLLGLVEDSYRLAYHDELTGLPGRRALDEALRTLDGDYAIAMVDVDHFKRFNDRYGHAAGDQALRMIAIELQQVGGGGRAFRYGGEEFAILFPAATPAEAREPLEKVRVSIGARRFALRAPDRPRKKPEKVSKKSRPPRLITVSVSIGVAGPNSRRANSDDVLRAADRALYRAKNAGRNRVVAAGDKLSKRR